MIVFSVAFGEQYISSLFERCLPSLFRSGKPPALAQERITFCLLTLTPFVDAMVKRAENSALLRAIGNVEILPVAAPAEIDKALARRAAGTLLQRAIRTCIDRNETFVHAVPDLIYSPTALENAYSLHRLTGRTVALFNGRIAKREKGERFTTAEILKGTATPQDTIAFFFNNMDQLWRNSCATSVGEMPCLEAGHFALQSPERCVVFCPRPNPFIGTFVPTDIPIFASAGGMAEWDHQWMDTLVTTNRLLVQTNLDDGMTCEYAVQEKKFTIKGGFEDALKLAGGSFELRRDFAFNTRPTYMFTTAYLRPAS